jgi:hypothetical protein
VLHAVSNSYSGLDHSNYICRGLQVMKLLIMEFSPAYYYFISLGS